VKFRKTSPVPGFRGSTLARCGRVLGSAARDLGARWNAVQDPTPRQDPSSLPLLGMTRSVGGSQGACGSGWALSAYHSGQDPFSPDLLPLDEHEDLFGVEVIRGAELADLALGQDLAGQDADSAGAGPVLEVLQGE